MQIHYLALWLKGSRLDGVLFFAYFVSMLIAKAKLVTISLMVFLVAGLFQPAVACVCPFMPLGTDAAFSADVDDTCIFVKIAKDHHSISSSTDSDHDTSSKIPAGNFCAMQAYCQSQIPPAVQHSAFSDLPVNAEFISFQGDICIPSSHLSGLFRPPTSQRHPLGAAL